MNERLWCGAEQVPLRPKAFVLLRYLVEHAQRLVTQEELLKAVWQRTYVSEGLLREYIRELRGLLGDDAKAPRFIETVPRRGYRFIAPVTPTPPVLSLKSRVQHPTPCCRLRGAGAGVGATPRLARAGAFG
jgi:DNA-binding winged helix-turn-helix (wHTH) protein